jgi:hypothetical protein
MEAWPAPKSSSTMGAGAAQLLQILAGDGEIGEHRGLGHLDLQTAGIHAGVIQYAEDALRGAGGAQLDGADVERQPHGLGPALCFRAARTSNISLNSLMTLICSATGMNSDGETAKLRHAPSAPAPRTP